jgi:RimJ/RimL family protein N-acetyltransferase
VSFRVRAAEPADAAQLVDLARAVGTEPEGWLLSDGWPRSVADERRYLRRVRRSPVGAVLVAEEPDGTLVGRLSVARDPHPASTHVADVGLMVAAAHRRRGVGRALLAAAEEWGRRNGIGKIELHVFPHNTAAIALYGRAGYDREGYRRAHLRTSAGAFGDVILMAKLL